MKVKHSIDEMYEALKGFADTQHLPPPRDRLTDYWLVSVKPGWSWSMPCATWAQAVEEQRRQAAQGNPCVIRGPR